MHVIMKKAGVLIIVTALLILLTACAPKPRTPDADISIAALKGPTAMGLARLLQNGDGYALSLAGSADEITPAIVKGEIDMACVPANLAAVLNRKTEGAIQVLAINTLGVLYIVENGESIRSIADLKGKTIVAAGKGATPEYALRYLLRENGIDPEGDITILWKHEHAECVAAIAAGQRDIALLPQPFVTAAQHKIDGLRIAIDLNDAWAAIESGSALITGVIVVRREFAQSHPDAVNAFLRAYAESVAWVHSNAKEAAAIIGEHGIVDASIAEEALPYCNIVCVTGSEMQDKLTGYLRILCDADPAAIGGAMPDDRFYYAGTPQ